MSADEAPDETPEEAAARAEAYRERIEQRVMREMAALVDDSARAWFHYLNGPSGSQALAVIEHEGVGLHIIHGCDDDVDGVETVFIPSECVKALISIMRRVSPKRLGPV